MLGILHNTSKGEIGALHIDDACMTRRLTAHGGGGGGRRVGVAWRAAACWAADWMALSGEVLPQCFEITCLVISSMAPRRRRIVYLRDKTNVPHRSIFLMT